MIGVLALQGDFAEHLAVLRTLKLPCKEVRTVADAKTTSGIILPGGESTAIGLQLRENGLGTWLKTAITKHNYPVYGTCAGCILLAKQVDSEFSLRVADIVVRRNAYGRQQDSFDEPIDSEVFKKLTGVFIRAPRITQIKKNVIVLARHGKDPVLVRQGHILAGTFHPELTGNYSVHRYFAKLCR